MTSASQYDRKLPERAIIQGTKEILKTFADLPISSALALDGPPLETRDTHAFRYHDPPMAILKSRPLAQSDWRSSSAQGEISTKERGKC